MADRIRITVDTKQLEQALGEIAPERAPIAIARGLNKAAANTKTQASRSIRQKRALPAKAVNDAIAIAKASKAKLTATIIVTGRPIPLRDYKARQTQKGVTVAVSPGARKRVVHNGNAAFIVNKIGGHVFAREGKARLPIKKLYGPSLPATFLQTEVRAAWERTANESIVKRCEEELRFELSRVQSR